MILFLKSYKEASLHCHWKHKKIYVKIPWIWRRVIKKATCKNHFENIWMHTVVTGRRIKIIALFPYKIAEKNSSLKFDFALIKSMFLSWDLMLSLTNNWISSLELTYQTLKLAKNSPLEGSKYSIKFFMKENSVHMLFLWMK